MNIEKPFLKIVPNIGWNNGLNLEICAVDITAEEMDWKQGQTARFKFKANLETLIVYVREVLGTSHYYVGFVPEEAIFVLVPAWIFSKVSDP